jgi:hypothetical protein
MGAPFSKPEFSMNEVIAAEGDRKEGEKKKDRSSMLFQWSEKIEKRVCNVKMLGRVPILVGNF